MNKNILYKKYSHNMRQYMSNMPYMSQYVRYMTYVTNMSNMSKYVKLNKDKFFYINLENPAPSMNKNILYKKYSHNMRQYMSNMPYMSQYVRYMTYVTNMSNMSKYVKLNKDKFFYINLENPAPTCLKLEMEKK